MNKIKKIVIIVSLSLGISFLLISHLISKEMSKYSYSNNIKNFEIKSIGLEVNKDYELDIESLMSESSIEYSKYIINENDEYYKGQKYCNFVLTIFCPAINFIYCNEDKQEYCKSNNAIVICHLKKLIMRTEAIAVFGIDNFVVAFPKNERIEILIACNLVVYGAIHFSTSRAVIFFYILNALYNGIDFLTHELV